MKKLLILILFTIVIIVSGCNETVRSGGNGNNPVISDISPTSGDSNTLITIRGSNFGDVQGNSKIYYGSQYLNPTRWSDTEIQVRLYDNTLSSIPTGHFTIEIDGRAAAQSAQEFTSVASSKIYSISPDNGKAGDIITITLASATNHVETFATFFEMRNPANARQVTIYKNSSTSYYCYVPTLPNEITEDNAVLGVQIGTYSASLQTVALFTYSHPDATISYITPNTVCVGDTVTIGSSNGGFGSSQGNSYLLVNGSYIMPTSWSSNAITFVMPDLNYGNETVSLALNVRGVSVPVSTMLTIRPKITNISATKVSNGLSGLFTTTYYYYIEGTGFTEASSVNIGVTLSSPPSCTRESARRIVMTSSSNLYGYRLQVKNGNSYSDYVQIPDAP